MKKKVVAEGVEAHRRGIVAVHRTTEAMRRWLRAPDLLSALASLSIKVVNRAESGHVPEIGRAHV